MEETDGSSILICFESLCCPIDKKNGEFDSVSIWEVTASELST